MDDEMFKELVQSMEQAGDIMKGKAKPLRVTVFAEPEVKATDSGMELTKVGHCDI